MKMKDLALAQVRRGEHFTLDGVEFVKLEDDLDAAFAVAADTLPECCQFEDDDAEREDHNNYAGSLLSKTVERWLRDKHPAIFSAVVERPIDLTTMDGMTDYGKPLAVVRALTIDEYRKHRSILPLTSKPYWLATGWTTNSSPNSDDNNAYYISTGGTVRNSGVYGAGFAPRPALYLKSSILVSVETEDEGKALADYSSTVLFWKENCLHKVLGSYPAQYEIYTYTVPGIQKGSEKSLAVINETLFYKGRNGVYAYSGGTPELLTENFGTRRFFDAVGGTDGERYYISMRTEKGDWELYVFDTLRAIWLREDATHALDWAYLDGTLYFLDGATGKLMTTGQDYSEEGLVNWSATLCQMDETSHGRKCYSKLYLRADLDAGAWLKVEISTDGKPFRQVFSTHNERAKTLQVPILPVRCDNFRIRLSGKGGCLVKSIIREFALGSEY